MATVKDRSNSLYIELWDDEIYTVKDNVIIITNKSKKTPEKIDDKNLKNKKKTKGVRNNNGN